MRVDEPLRWAAENGHADVVKFLLQKGANIHAGILYRIPPKTKHRRHDAIRLLKKQRAILRDEGFIQAKNDK